MSKEMWSAVAKFRNGDSLDADTLNVPIDQLGERTAWLYARLKELMASGKMSSVILTDVALSTDEGEEPELGNVVYLDREHNRFALAKARMSLYDDFTAADAAFTIGILCRKEAATGDVLAYGNMDLNPTGIPYKVSDLLESGETFRAGRYYLSANEAGKLTANPNGPLIFVCSITGSVTSSGRFAGASAIVTPQFLDIGTSHVHRTAVLTARPAGTLSVDGYLPVSYDTDNPSRAMKLSFGGSWTPKDGTANEIRYRFSLSQNQATWPKGVELNWVEWHDDDENGIAGSVRISGPDVEVPISNGLTVRLTLPEATATTAYSVSSVEERTWPTLVFPNAGKGWKKHLPFGVADLSEDSSNDAVRPHVAIRGKLDATTETLFAAFPKTLQVLSLGAIADGSTFTYDDVIYEFTEDNESYSGDNTPVDIGVTKADSALYLAKVLNALGKGRFAVLEVSSDEVKLVAMDAEEIAIGGIVIYAPSQEAGQDYNVVGASAMKLVLFDGESRVRSTSATVSGIQSYQWSDAGNGFSVMVFQDPGVSGDTAVVESGSVFSCVMEDFEPDAAYDYALGFEPAVANYWPPVPVKSAALIVNGVEMDNKALLPEHPTVSFGRDTIHWFAQSDGRKPWPDDFGYRDGDRCFDKDGEEIDPSSDKTEVMHWVRGFQGATGPVTSLQAREGSPFKVVGFGTNEYANTGDLEIVGDFDFSLVNGGAPGFLVPKRARGGKLIAGPVVERVLGGPGISVVSQAGSPSGQGTVIVALDNGAYHSQFTDIALENAEQAKIGMFPYIRLKGYSTTITHPSAFTAMMRVPTNLPDGRYYLLLQASVFGENGFDESPSQQYACVKMSYNILPDYRVSDGLSYRNLKTSLLKPDSERTIQIPFGHGDGSYEYRGFDPILVRTNDKVVKDEDDVVSNAFQDTVPCDSDFYGQTINPYLRPGYLVGIRIARAVTPSDKTAYTGPIGFINLSWSLVSAFGYGDTSLNVDQISNEISSLKTAVAEKVSKDALAGVDFATNNAAGIRDAVKTLGGTLGATIVK